MGIQVSGQDADADLRPPAYNVAKRSVRPDHLPRGGEFLR